MKKILLLSLALLFAASFAPAGGKKVYLLKVEGIINPAIASYVVRGIERAEREGGHCVVIQLDTPGGLMESMRQIVKKILGAEVPVVVYVAPSGSRAGSAGVFITLAAHVAAMAPGTNIGAAHPVQMGEKKMDEEMAKKVLNDAVAYIKTIAKERGRNPRWAEKAVRESASITAKEALKLKVIDLIAPTFDDLLVKLQGRKVKLASGVVVALDTKGAEVVEVGMSFRDRLLHTISNPSIAYILLMLGIYGLFFELSNPGAVFPGVVGGICLILAFFAFQMLPINYAGVALIVLGIILLILEVKITSYGLLSIGGVLSILLGSLMLIESPAQYLRLSLSFVLPVVIVTAGFFLFALTMVIRAHRRRPTTGREGLVGRRGEARTALAPEGLVEVFGELWRAEATDGEIPAGEAVEVVGVEGMKLKVKKAKKEG
ncbi:MAG TPA: nodulation protein NfeD [Deltaproteobacteria bacterium]|nr:nodulation protein NfeD [Deltaproteobacteria bacterium]